jgi:hypothetical protein
MKKIILGIVFIFASFTVVNAKSEIEKNEISIEVVSYSPCSELADAVTESIGIAIGGFVSHVEEINIWVGVYDSCILAAIRDMEEPRGRE